MASRKAKRPPAATTARKRARAGAKPPAPRTAETTIAGVALGTLAPRQRKAVQYLAGEVELLRAELAAMRERAAALERLVDEDPLAPVANRRAFLRELTRMLAFAARYGIGGSVVYLDVNDLKRINDAHGHAAGDAVLMQVARVLVESVRSSDVVARLGGDEFAVLLVRADAAQAEGKAAELARLVDSKPVSWQGKRLPATVAFGVYAFVGGENAADVLDAADRAMYGRKPDFRR